MVTYLDQRRGVKWYFRLYCFYHITFPGSTSCFMIAAETPLSVLGIPILYVWLILEIELRKGREEGKTAMLRIKSER